MINQAPSTDDARPAGRRAQILDAALHVMAEHGFQGASIKRIAARAGLKSPALIYWYFRDKQALFDAVLQRMAPFLGSIAQAEALLDDPPERVLPLVVNGFLTTVQQPTAGRVMRLLLSEVMRHPSAAEFFAERGPLVVIGFLERYFARQIELGTLRAHDTRASARAFMGMLLVYALGHEILPQVGAGFPPADTYAETVTKLALHGLRV